MKNIAKWTTLAFVLSFFVALGLVPNAQAFTVTDGLHVLSTSALGGTIYNPQTSVTIGDNLDIRGYVHNEAGHVVIQDDLVVNGKIISNLQQVYGGVTDYRGTIFNSTADVYIGDNLMVDGYIHRLHGDIKLFDGVMVQGELYPYKTNTFNLGTKSKAWKNVYTSNLSAADLMFSSTLTGPNANFTNDVTIGNELTVNKAANFKDTLTVEGLTTINGGLTADGGVLTVADNTGDLYTGGTLMVDNNADFGSNITLAGVADVQTNLFNSTGSLVVNDNLEVWGLTDLQNNVYNSMGDLNVNDNLAVTGTLSVTGATSLNNTLTVAGLTTLNNQLIANDDVYLGNGDDTIELRGGEVSIADTSGSTWGINNNGNATINSLVNTGTSDLQGNVFNSTDDNIFISDSLMPNGANPSQRYLGFGSNSWNEIWLNGAAVIRDAGTGSAQHSASFGFVQNTGSNESTMYTTQYYMVDDGNVGTNSSTLRANRLEVTDGSNTSSYGVNADVQGSISNSTGDLALNDNLSVTGDILPSTDDTYDVGSATLRWQDGYFSDSVNIGDTLTLSDAGISDDNSNVIVNDNLEVNGTLSAGAATFTSLQLTAGIQGTTGDFNTGVYTPVLNSNYTGSGANQALAVDAKGTGTVTIGGTSTGNIILGAGAANAQSIQLNAGTGGGTVAVTGGNFTIGGSFTVAPATGNMTGVGTINSGAITSTGAIQGTSLTDGTATLTGGALSTGAADLSLDTGAANNVQIGSTSANVFVNAPLGTLSASLGSGSGDSIAIGGGGDTITIGSAGDTVFGDFSTGGALLPNGTTLPADCFTGAMFIDTDGGTAINVAATEAGTVNVTPYLYVCTSGDGPGGSGDTWTAIVQD